MPTQPLTRAITQSLTRTLTDPGLGGGVTPLPIPTGFDWTPPVNVYRSAEGVYSTDFNTNSWVAPASVEYWVGPLGNDTTGNGTQALPWRSIAKALTEAQAGADVVYTINVLAGEYSAGSNPYKATGTVDRAINLIAVGGRVVCNGKFAIASGAWTSIGSNTYQTTRSGTQGVLDYANTKTWPNGDVTPSNLNQVADVATVQATPGSFHFADNVLTLHLIDGRFPDSTSAGTCAVIASATSGLLHSSGKPLYVRGFDFHLPVNVGIRARNNTANSPITSVVLDDCTVAYHGGTVSGRAFELDGVSSAILNNCRALGTVADGMGYSQISGPDPSCRAVEINCHSYECGTLLTNTAVQNGSTNHADGRTVRVNCVFRDCYGPVVADIGTTQNWNLGVDAQDCLLASGTQQDACFSTYGGTAETWLDGCTTGGAFYDLYADTGCAIHYRNMAAPASTGGTGTIGTY